MKRHRAQAVGPSKYLKSSTTLSGQPSVQLADHLNLSAYVDAHRPSRRPAGSTRVQTRSAAEG
jgi:hypothetical protein